MQALAVQTIQLSTSPASPGISLEKLKTHRGPSVSIIRSRPAETKAAEPGIRAWREDSGTVPVRASKRERERDTFGVVFHHFQTGVRA